MPKARRENASDRFGDKRGDWEAFEDAKIEGYRRRDAHLASR